MTSILPDTIKPATLLSKRFRFDQIPDLSGRVAIVTGGSAGIGYFTALPLARAGATVIILSANEEKGKSTEAEINRELKGLASYGSVTWEGVDLADLNAVNALAKRLAEELERLDLFIANAGIGQAPYGLTSDGLERHFEVSKHWMKAHSTCLNIFKVNNLSHHLLIMRLLPIMKKTAQIAPPATVRVIMQSSEMHRLAPGGTKFLNREEINQERDGSQL